MKDLVERFLRYVSIDTQSNPSAPQCPSTEKQFNLATQLIAELTELELSDVSLDDNGYVVSAYSSYPSIPVNNPSVEHDDKGFEG